MEDFVRVGSAEYFALLGLLVGCTRAADEPWRSDKAERTASARRGEIEAEIKSLADHPWAGSYDYGDGLGVNVSSILAPKAGYVFEWHGCLGLYDRNYGAVASQQGALRPAFTFPNRKGGFHGIAEKLLPVAWGER